MQSVMPVLYEGTLVITIISVMFVAFQKPSHDQKMLLAILYVSGITALGYTFKGWATGLEGLVIGQKMIYFGGSFSYYLMLVFYLNYCGKRLKRWQNIILIILNSTIAVIAFHFDSNTLLYRSYDITYSDGVLTLTKDYGPVHTIYIIEILVCVISMIAVAVGYRIKNGRAGVGKMVRLLIVVMGPTVAYSADRIFQLPYDFVPLGLLFSIITVLYLVYIEKIYDVNDIARQRAFAYMDSAYIVSDDKGRYQGCNPLAKELFPELRVCSMGTDINHISSEITSIVQKQKSDFRTTDKIYESSVIDISEEGKQIGNLIWFSNVTSLRQHLELVEKYQTELESKVEEKTHEAEERRKKVEQMSLQMVRTLANTIDAKDRYTNGHSSRVAEYAVILARELNWTDEQLEILRYQGLLHDIGKIGIPDSILNKPSKLTAQEYEVIKSHTKVGSEVLFDTTAIPGAEMVARYHHERYDGSGYPDGLKGEDIPIEARIICIADAYDAMNSNRVYRKTLSNEEIREELVRGTGTQFDPNLVTKFVKLFDEGQLELPLEQTPSSNFYIDVNKNISGSVTIEMDKLIESIRSNGEYKGAFSVDYDVFTDLYEYINSLRKRYHHDFSLCMINAAISKDAAISERNFESSMKCLENSIKQTIRSVDICTRLSGSQMLMVLLDVGVENVDSVIQRIFQTFYKANQDGPIELFYETAHIDSDK